MPIYQLTWTANPASELVTGYEVWEKINDGDFQYKTFVTNPQYSFAPAISTSYRWKVRANNIVGASEFSDEAGSPTVPSKPGTITVTIV